MTSVIHKPVLLNEVINFLNIRRGKVYVDCTLGAGGHSFHILQKLEGNGILIGIEQDKETFEIAKDRLKQFKNCYLFNKNYLELRNILKSLNICNDIYNGNEKITGGILLDLGINSIQLSNPSRGFSFQFDSPLDMRIDKTQKLTAESIVNECKESDLADLIYKYGEERYSRRIAKLIVRNRPIKTTKELRDIVVNCYPKKNRNYRIHPATKTFQALRIEVNNELANLEKFLCFTGELLLSGSRLIVISFHSLEDRIVKRFLKNNQDFKLLVKKPIIPSANELKDNPRARSAKLRVAEKI